MSAGEAPEKGLERGFAEPKTYNMINQLAILTIWNLKWNLNLCYRIMTFLEL